jgi:hypothetical protein
MSQLVKRAALLSLAALSGVLLWEPWLIAQAPAPFKTDMQKLKSKGQFTLPGKHARPYDPTIQLSADGKCVAVGVQEAKTGKTFTQVWQLSPKPKVLAELPKSFGGGVFALSPSGKRVIVSGAGVFDVESGKSVGKGPPGFSHAYFRDEETAVCVQRSHDFSKAAKRSITVWDVAQDKDAGSFEIADDRFTTALPARGGKELWLFMAAGRFEVECYDIADKKLKQTLKPPAESAKKPHKDAGIWQAVAPDGSVFAASVSGESGSAHRVYDGKSGKIVGTLPAEVYGLPVGLIPGGARYLVTPNETLAKKGPLSQTDVIVCNWRTGKGLAALTGFAAGQSHVHAGVSADGKTVVVVSEQGEALVFDVSSVK